MERKAAYEKLKFYLQICELRELVYKITERFARSHFKLVSQMRDAARSAKQNIREGYRRGYLKEFIRAIKISQGSLDELIGDIEDCKQDGLITKEEFEPLSQLANSGQYLMARYVQSLYKIEKEESWKFPGKVQEAPAPYATSRSNKSVTKATKGYGKFRNKIMSHNNLLQPLVTSCNLGNLK